MATSFVLVSDQELGDLIESADSVNTKKQIQYAVSRLEAYAVFTGTSLAAVEALPGDELDVFLSRFFAGLRKADGSLYTKKSMHGIKYGLHRHFKAVKDVDITKSDIFRRSHEAYKAMMVKLKKEGKGSVRHKDPVSKEDMAKIFGSESVDITTPLGLQNKVFLDIMIYFANRGRENLREMKVDDFVIQTDEQNLRYIAHRDTLTKARRENEDEGYSGFMYEIPGSPRCPVSSFLAYKAALNPALDLFWQRPKATAPAEGPWYSNSPLGVNTLGNKMKNIAEAAGCGKKYTNHSLRATTVTVLDHAGVASRDIMSVTGHRSESSLKHYAKTSHEMKKEMSSIIAKHMEDMEEKSNDSNPTNVNDDTDIHDHDGTSLDIPVDILPVLTNSQEQTILNESNFNIRNQMASSVQHFHFHGPVHFFNK